MATLLHTLRTDAKHLSQRRRAGFTLIESLIASVVLAIAVVGIAGAIASSFNQTAQLDQDAAAVSAARALLEEAASKPFASSTASSRAAQGNFNRSTYANVADYHLYHDSAPFATLSGAPVDIGSGYSRKATYTCPASVTAIGSTTSRSDFGQLTVTVTAPSGRTLTLSRLVTSVTFAR